MNIEKIREYNCLYTTEERKQITAKMISEFRILNKLQKKEVAELIGIKPQTYGAYESGRNELPLEILVRLSILYDVSIDVLTQKDNMKKDVKGQVEYYEKEINQLRIELLKGTPEAQETLSLLIDGMQALTEAIKNGNKTEN